MRKLLLCTAILTLLVPAVSAELKLPRVSQKATAMQTVGLTDVTITCSRPGVKGRVIWGDLVPYDKVWRTGANEATTFAVSKDVTIDGKPLPAGTYSLHTIPGKTSWTIIFNKKADQWGSYSYDAAQDALRIETRPTEGPNVEWLTFSFPDVSADVATVELAWEKKRVRFLVETDTTKQAMVDIRKELSGEVTQWNVPFNAANFAFNAGPEYKAEAMKWIDQSIAVKETLFNLRLKAQMLAKDGRTAQAIAVAEKAVSVGKDDKNAATEIPSLEKQIADWKAAPGK
jgi:hypothetical protein